MSDHQSKQSYKTKGLKECHRKMITNMKMTKSSQKCSICCSDFCEGKNISNRRLNHKEIPLPTYFPPRLFKAMVENEQAVSKL